MNTNPPLRSIARPLREEYGRSLREIVRRVDQDTWIDANADGRNVLDRLRNNEQGRIDEVLPFRHGRMSASPFAFLRGGAAIMAPDLMALPHTGYCVQICGDAHVRNLGAYSDPNGKIVFDVNDFDETTRAPWEWDMKRLAISFVLVAREGGTSDSVARDAVMELARSWRESLHTARRSAGVRAAALHRASLRERRRGRPRAREGRAHVADAGARRARCAGPRRQAAVRRGAAEDPPRSRGRGEARARFARLVSRDRRAEPPAGARLLRAVRCRVQGRGHRQHRRAQLRRDVRGQRAERLARAASETGAAVQLRAARLERRLATARRAARRGGPAPHADLGRSVRRLDEIEGRPFYGASSRITRRR